MIRVLKTIDCHVGGQPLRLVVDGMPSPTGATMLRKQQWMERHVDHLRRALVLEPRGHANMCAAAFTEPVSPGSHAGLVFMHAGGYTALCGHGLIGAVTIAIERQIIVDRASVDAAQRILVIDTAAGSVTTRARVVAHGDRPRVDAVAFVVPSFVSGAGLAVKLGTRELRVDVAFGGAFYAIVDAEAVGLPLDPGAVPELRRVAAEMTRALASSDAVAHPTGVLDLIPELTGTHLSRYRRAGLHGLPWRPVKGRPTPTQVSCGVRSVQGVPCTNPCPYPRCVRTSRSSNTFSTSPSSAKVLSGSDHDSL